jgi:hypothetical protein
MKTSVVGLGYVELPLSLQFARSGVLVLGLDTDPEKVALLNAYIYVRMFFYPFTTSPVERATASSNADNGE